MKKRIAMVLSLVCAVSLLAAACGNSKKEVEDTDTSAGKTKTIKIVTGGDGEPFSLIDNDGKWTGIDAEIWAEIEKRTGWKAEVEKTTFDSVFGELDAGRADVAANCFAAKEERNEKYQPSIPYYGDAQTIAVADDNKDIQTFDDLKNKKVGIISGQASQTILDEMSKEIGFDVITYEQANIGCQDLTLGRIDAMASAVTVFNNYMEANDAKVRMLDEKLLANNVTYYFPKTDEGKALCDAVDKELQDMLDDGTIAKITEKWLFADMTKLITK
ncbi:transporter substrate-binding domain-containing protein [Clostridium sp. C105KSO13]|uniref:transporter substrate-binding domain-containing protein n=1 Tax=Clostridium sp. C105KSO13 TaxID=1776045 RepID=UPI0007405ED7|nr:transporter substrate-binding domain-containing protein [Clostridium sp. C105KSO13]CUX44660.1 putative amino-acid-binding protein YxeM precursor [Clostridium sp. C105KSO13]